MRLNQLDDRQLLKQTKQLACTERELLTNILHHLREVERRKLFCDLGCGSLFEYAVKELKYSDGQAGRRIQALRLTSEIPEAMKKLETGELSLSNVSQAQSFFREVNKLKPYKPMKTSEKKAVLKKLENKTRREGQKELVKLHPVAALPREKERVITENQSEVRFVMDTSLKEKLEEVRSLMGPKGVNMNFAELFEYLTDARLKELKAKKFGKKRSEQDGKTSNQLPLRSGMVSPRMDVPPSPKGTVTPPEDKKKTNNNRYVSKENVHHIWQRDKGKCSNCGSRVNLNVDHVKPVAMGGNSKPHNLRILCFNCNQRAAMKSFGVEYMKEKSKSSMRT